MFQGGQVAIGGFYFGFSILSPVKVEPCFDFKSEWVADLEQHILLIS